MTFEVPKELISGNLGLDTKFTSTTTLPNKNIQVDEVILSRIDQDTFNSNCSLMTSKFDISETKRVMLAEATMKRTCTTTCPPNTCDPETENCGPREGCTKTCTETDEMKNPEVLGITICNSYLSSK